MRYDIYTLTCPVTNKVVYIGCTSIGLKNRLKCHNSAIGSVEKRDYTFSIRPHKFTIQSLDVAYNFKKALEIEKYWIHQFTAWGFKLLNRPVPTRQVKCCIYGFSFKKKELVHLAKAIKTYYHVLDAGQKYGKIYEYVNIRLQNHIEPQNRVIRTLQSLTTNRPQGQ